MKRAGLKILDIYIIKKFLGTFFFSILLIISIAVVFDLYEKLDDFIENDAPVKLVLFEYYLNFIPYFALLFSYLFTFISVIFFTSKMSYNTEIIAILSSGVSFRRMLLPYFISAFIIASLSFVLNNFVIPHANARRLAFEQVYYRDFRRNTDNKNIHMQVRPGMFIYMQTYSEYSRSGYNFTIEKFEENKLVSKLTSPRITWDTTLNKWNIRNYYIRDIINGKEYITEGEKIDTTIFLTPEDFIRKDNIVDEMNFSELNEYIDQQKLLGSDLVDELLVEKHNRLSFPFSTFILALIGVTLSSKKARGGIGFQIGIGILLSFSYIVFMQFSKQFAIGGNLDPLIASWIPNIIYAIIAIFLYKVAPK